jgi:outer membrane protein TolC
MASLAKQRIEIAQQYAKLSRAMYSSGTITSATYFDAEREVFLAERDSGLKGAELVAAARAYRDAAVTAQQLTEQRQKMGASSEADVQLAKLRSLEASYWLAQASAE